MNIIPKGSTVYVKGKPHKTNKDFTSDYVTMPEDYEPPLPIGTEVDNGEAWFCGRLIYRHPDFMCED